MAATQIGGSSFTQRLSSAASVTVKLQDGQVLFSIIKDKRATILTTDEWDQLKAKCVQIDLAQLLIKEQLTL